LSAEAVSADSESSRSESCFMSDSRLSRRSRICVSVAVSSSVGLGAMVDGWANWEYVWKRVSVCAHVSFWDCLEDATDTWDSAFLVCCRS
jgi:hypothetical protein